MNDTRKAATELYANLDGIARDYDHYEYGLPSDGLVDGDWQNKGINLIEAALVAARDAATKAERERCAKIAESTTVILNGLVIESLNANRSATAASIRALKEQKS